MFGGGDQLSRPIRRLPFGDEGNARPRRHAVGIRVPRLLEPPQFARRADPIGPQPGAAVGKRPGVGAPFFGHSFALQIDDEVVTRTAGHAPRIDFGGVEPLVQRGGHHPFFLRSEEIG